VGIGGGIILSPLIILLRWGTPKQAASTAAGFIFLNSLSGLLGRYIGGNLMFGELGAWLLPVGIVGALAGSYFGARRFSCLWARRVLGVVLLIAVVRFWAGYLGLEQRSVFSINKGALHRRSPKGYRNVQGFFIFGWPHRRHNQDIARPSLKASTEQFVTTPHFWHNKERCGANKTRNPRLLFLLFGVFLLRLATRASSILLFHEPPRHATLSDMPFTTDQKIRALLISSSLPTDVQLQRPSRKHGGIDLP